MAVKIHRQKLISANPAVNCTTKVPSLKAKTTLLAMAINHTLDEIKFSKVMGDIVLNALMGMGIAKIGLVESSRSYEAEGEQYDVGQPFVSSININNWVHDMAAHRIEDASFLGDSYYLNLDFVKDCELFDKKQRKQVKSIDKKDELDRTPEYFEDQVLVWDFYLPTSKRLVSIWEPEGAAIVLRDVEYQGPDGGPYKVLSYDNIPTCSVPIPPASHWVDMHLLANSLWRKLSRQAERQKNITIVPGASGDDQIAINRARDGEAIAIQSTNITGKESRMGGPDQLNGQFFLQSKQNFSWLSNNSDLMGGLGAQSQTLGQDRLLEQNSAAVMKDMQEKTATFVKEICRDIGWMLWNDPWIEIPLTKRLPGTDIEVNVKFDAYTKSGDFLDYNIDIEPYSLQTPSPSEKATLLTKLMTEIILPLGPQLEQLGVGLNPEAFIRIVGKYLNLPEVEDIVTFTGATATMEEPALSESGKTRPSRPPAERQYRNVTPQPEPMEEGMPGVNLGQSNPMGGM
jgi:hypothetical protein